MPGGARAFRPGKAALITGASSGIGETFARVLAARGVDLLLTARPEDAAALERVADDLAARHRVRCPTVPVDLARRDGTKILCAAVASHGFEPDVLVNSAGVGSSGRFSSAPLDEQLQMLHLNVEAVVALTRHFLPRMAARGHGAVINVASTAAFEPQPYFAVYAASKAFALRFGEALWAEQRGSGVRVVTVCTGPVAERGRVRHEGPVREFLKRRYLTAEEVVERALDAVEQDRPVVVLRVPVLGWAYHVRAVVGRLLPRRARLRVAGRLNGWYFERT